MLLKTGLFTISPGQTVAGELRLDGRKSSVILRDTGVELDSTSSLWIEGRLYDLTKVTLIHCIPIGRQTRIWPEEGTKTESITLFPHFVALGRVQLHRDACLIQSVQFTFKDASSMFYDFDAFGTILEAAPYIDALVDINAKMYGRPIRTGPSPEIAYFAGQRLIMEVDTALGTVRAEHMPTIPIGGPRGVRIDNKIGISITPVSLITFDDAVERILQLLRFITVAVGRRQTISSFALDVSVGNTIERLHVHWSHHPKRFSGRIGASNAPQPRDLPLDPIHHLDEFRVVLKSWLLNDNERRAARVRIDESFSHLSFYPIDRLVGAANAFDLLPLSAVPGPVALAENVLAAKKQCKAIFRALPDSDERESLLRALGRLGHATLKQKVRHRAQFIKSACGEEHFDSLHYVCDHAVDCRNYFVHGSRVSFEFELPSPQFSFLTDTLEFVFIASELIEAGWNLSRFLSANTTMTHPLGAYMVSYRDNVEALRKKDSPRATGAEKDP